MNRLAPAVPVLGLVIGVAIGLPAQDVPRWTKGRDIIDGRSGEVVVTTPKFGITDIAGSQGLESHGTAWVLRDFEGQEVWRIEQLAPRAFGKTSPKFTKERIVFATETGVAAFDRANGRPAWAESACPSDLVVVHGDLVIGADKQRRGDEAPRLAAYAVLNGSRAFCTELPGVARRIVAADHGIAVLGREYVVVHDRFGPELFRRDGNVIEMAATAKGWVILPQGRLRAVSLDGTELWNAPIKQRFLDSFGLATTAGGDLLCWRYCDMADAGFEMTCHDPIDGSVKWTHAEPGLGVWHSKYHHRAMVKCAGDGVFVLSAGSAGCFVVELDASDGSRRGRHKIE